MPINAEMMASMVKKYGAKKGKDVYYGVEMKNKKKMKLKRKKLGNADRLAKRLRGMPKH